MVDVELIKSIPFFDSFTQEQLDIIALSSSIESFRAEDLLLQENQINLNLYFLIEGAVDIYVDGDFVVTYTNNGEVIGEMSIANHAPSSARVVVKIDSSFIVLPFPDLQNATPAHIRDSMLKNFYKSCAEILARKLKTTNKMMKEYYKAQKK